MSISVATTDERQWAVSRPPSFWMLLPVGWALWARLRRAPFGAPA